MAGLGPVATLPSLQYVPFVNETAYNYLGLNVNITDALSKLTPPPPPVAVLNGASGLPIVVTSIPPKPKKNPQKLKTDPTKVFVPPPLDQCLVNPDTQTPDKTKTTVEDAKPLTQTATLPKVLVETAKRLAREAGKILEKKDRVPTILAMAFLILGMVIVKEHKEVTQFDVEDRSQHHRQPPSPLPLSPSTYSVLHRRAVPIILTPPKEPALRQIKQLPLI